ncbi:hypothetical protein FB562_1979 [Homoserinimonas aerilata]|uniref:Uncharacterized protein n=1 Tax=Homoserinimonas aerilata TaxID=1162970 RepID=A0A542YL92_9MICO|nr:hypothetical protein [Homoserinimonas aerilata]TQL48872.1 hypothetical protein FB562_1979 [Homoserinimonas aerilata]
MNDSNNTSDEQPTIVLDQTTTPDATPTTDARRPVRTGTVVWGVILLAAAGFFVATRVVFLDQLDGWAVLAWSAIALGAIFVVGAIAAALRRR